MNIKRLSIAIILALITPVGAYGYKYSVDSIPMELRENAAAVVRTHQMVYTVESVSRAKVSNRLVVTLMNESADDLRYFEVPYDRFRTVQRLSAAVYDADGKFVESIPASRIMDVAEGSGFVSDSRRKIIFFPVNRYPFTIEIEYDELINGSLNLSGWSFYPDPYLSVEESGVQYIIPNSVPFRYSEFYMNASFDSIRTEDHTLYTWVQKSMPAIKRWYFSPLALARRPLLLAAIDDFEFGGIAGSMRSWKSLGEWAWKLNQGLDQLSDAEKKHVSDLTAVMSDNREKAKALYSYMQSRTRYASIQLGIGGFKPAPAMEVSEKGYGDCKGLTNYMSALLKEAGITSYYTWVKSGTNENIIPSFVSDQFDHIILCVPLQGDTVWLECTNQTLPFDYLGTFTSDRDVLLITEEGGKLVHTPQFRHSYTKNYGVITLGRREPSRGSFTMTAGGKGFDRNRIFYGKTVVEMKRMLNTGMSLGTFRTDTASYAERGTDEPVSDLMFDLTLPDFSVVTGAMIHFRPCLNPLDYQPFDTTSVKVYESEDIIDSIVYIIPAGFRAEHLPALVTEKGPCGTYSYSVENISDGSLLYLRKLKINMGIYTGDRAKELFAFLNLAAKNDQRRVYITR